MSRILRLLFEFQTPYSGDIRFITGNAIRHALSAFDGDIDCSVGKLTDLPYLTEPKSYHEFFRFRTRKYLPPFNMERYFDKYRNRIGVRVFYTPRFVTFDVLDPSEGFLSFLQKKKLLQLGGRRNSGFGVVALKEFVWIDLEDINLPDRATHLTLLAPMVFLPGIVEKYECRQEQLRIWNHSTKNNILVFSPGQFYRLKPKTNISKVAMEGITRRLRKGHTRLLNQFGFGEYILNDFHNGGKKS